jgi:inosine-uridine nucleoside N-ribohydrolase
MNRIRQCIFLLVVALLYSCNSEKNNRAVKIILDTDIAGDYDDVGAVAVLHNLADKNEAEILAVMSCNAFPTTVPTISVLNEYFGRPEIPIGVTKEEWPNKDCPQKWAEAIIARYPHSVKSNDAAPDAVELYRKILSSQPDTSVTIVTVGFFTNLANLLKSSGDAYSELTGRELVKKKVKQLVSMAAGIEQGKESGREYNVYVDAPSSKKVFEDWPTPVTLSGFEIGERILTGIKLIHNESIKDSPVKDAYEIALKKDNNTKGRMSWDQTAVLVAIKGIEPFFGYRELNFEIKEDGTNVILPGKKFKYLLFKETPEEISSYIEELMMDPPARKDLP